MSEVGGVEGHGPGEAGQAGPSPGSAEDVLGVDLEHLVVVRPRRRSPGTSRRCAASGSVVGPLVLPDDALPAPHEVTLEQPPAVGVAHRGVELGFREAGAVEHQSRPGLHRRP